MAFRTKLDFSSNRQVKQRIETFTHLSGGTAFGVPFSSLPVGPNLATSGITFSSTTVLSTFSGNSTNDVYVWYYPQMNSALWTLSAITPTTSAITQNALSFSATSYATLDGNTFATAYSGISFDITPISITDLGGGNYVGSVQTNLVEFLSAATLDFTGRTIWNDVSGITRTQDLIITRTPIVGATLECIDSEGKGSWIPASASTSGLWVGGSGLHSVRLNNGANFASGINSVAEGTGTVASGHSSHAEGYFSIASGEGSHAEGGYASVGWASGGTASGNGSHAEGFNTIARGNASHAEGFGCITRGNYTHAEGVATTAGLYLASATYISGSTNNCRFELTDNHGDITSLFSTGDMLYIDDSGANSNFSKTNTPSLYSVYTAVFTNFGIYSATVITLNGNFSYPDDYGVIFITNFGNLINSPFSSSIVFSNSHAEGIQTYAIGYTSHAEGTQTLAGANSSHAEGHRTKASGSYSHAEGYETIASGMYSHAEGNNTKSEGWYSHAEGLLTIASGTVSHAEGQVTLASGEASHAEGIGTTASGMTSHAEGDGTIAYGYAAHAEGIGTVASGNSSHAEGSTTIASGYASHAEGSTTIASGYASHAEGGGSVFNGISFTTYSGGTALGQGSHAEGWETFASGYTSHAEGYDSKAIGNFTHAEGLRTLASGIASHAEGTGTTASGNYSHAEGFWTIASGESAHAEGVRTVASGPSSHAEGYQCSATTNSGAHAEGYNTLASNVASHAQGFGTIASGNTSHAMGQACIAGANNTFAGGQNSSTYAHNSMIFGTNSIILSAATWSNVFGRNITGTTQDTTYVDNFNIKTLGAGPGTSIGVNGGGQIVLTASDIRLKENISTLTNSLDKIKNLRGVTFQLIDREANGDDFRIGFIAQEVNQIVPELTFINKTIPEQYMGVHYGDVTALLVEAVKELASGGTSNNYLQTQTILAEDNNIELNYSGTPTTALGGGITVLHGMGVDLSSELIIDADGNWTTNNDFIPNKITLPAYTPSGSTDTNGNLGNVTRDDDYLYVRTSTGWKRTNLANF